MSRDKPGYDDEEQGHMHPAEQAKLLLQVFTPQTSDKPDQTYRPINLPRLWRYLEDLTHGVEHEADEPVIRRKWQKRGFRENYML